MSAAVGQILIAEMLIEQYFATARKVAGALSVEPDALDLYMAEANRIYEGVWSHLDHARARLADDGRDVAAYDSIRAEQGNTTHMGIADFERGEWQIDVARSVMSMGLAFSQPISIRLNLAGAVYAQHALAALAATMPEVDWAAARTAATTVPESGRRFELGRGFGALAILVVAAIAGLIAATIAGGSTSAARQCDRATELVGTELVQLRRCTGDRGAAALACGASAARGGSERIAARDVAYPPLASAVAEVAGGLGAMADGLEALPGGGDADAVTDAAERVRAGVAAMGAACQADGEDAP